MYQHAKLGKSGGMLLPGKIFENASFVLHTQSLSAFSQHQEYDNNIYPGSFVLLYTMQFHIS